VSDEAAFLEEFNVNILQFLQLHSVQVAGLLSLLAKRPISDS